MRDGQGDALFVVGHTAAQIAALTGGGYAKGCIAIATDGTTGAGGLDDTWYMNVGTNTTGNFDVLTTS
jgi:hypothetical protein